jgi:hypothetical protein
MSAEQAVACWYLARREADARTSIVRPCHLSKYAAAWEKALEGDSVYLELDVPGLTAERVAAAERALVSDWSRRHAGRALSDAQAKLEAGGEAGAIQADVARALSDAASGGLVRSETHREVAGRVIERWVGDLTGKDAPRMIPVPWTELQKHTGGLPKGKLILLGGRSSEHKTTTAREILECGARYFAESCPDENALYWTMEDAAEDVAGRTIADNVSALTTRDLMTGTHKGRRPTLDAMNRIAQEMRAHVSEKWTKHLRYTAKARPRISLVLSVLSAHAARGCTLAALDFFHLIRPDRGEMNPDAARDIATALHEAAKDLGMCILALGQLDKVSTLASTAEARVPFAAEMLYGSMLKQTAFGAIMVGLGKVPGRLEMLVEKWKASDPNVTIYLAVDPAHDRILDWNRAARRRRAARVRR